MAQMLFSFSSFCIGLLLNNVSEWCTIYCYLWKCVDCGIMFQIQMGSVFKWLVWISSYIELLIMEHIFGVPYALLISISNKQYQLRFLHSVRKKNIQNRLPTFDERMMVLSGLRIYADLAYLFCRPTYLFRELLYNLQGFQKNIFQRMWYKHYQNMPPWPKIFTYLRQFVMIVVVILSVFLMVMEHIWSTMKNLYHQKLYNFKYKAFYDCKTFDYDDLHYFDCLSTKENCFNEHELVFFDCLSFDVPPQKNIEAPKQVPKYCTTCPLTNYNIKLPMFRQALLIALQNDSNKNAYVSFDPDTEQCVVDNSANVHIWNDFSAFIPESYIKFNQAASTAVSAVNGESNVPAGCGDVPVQWTDDDDKIYEIALKNVLHFPNSPVKILSVVELAEQLKDDLDTWILSRRYQSIFTWAFGKFTKTIAHGKSRLPELLIKSCHSTVGALYSLVKKSQTANCHMVFHAAFKVDRSDISQFENAKYECDIQYSACNFEAYNNDVSSDDEYTIVHDTTLPPAPVLSIGCSVRYTKDDHVEVGTLVGVDLSSPSSPSIFDIEFSDGRKVQTTREHIELEETPDVFAIPTNARNILEVASTITKEDLNAIMNPGTMTPLQQLWLWWHEVLDHLPRPAMNRLVDKGSLPAKFKALKDWKFVCPDCLLAIQRKLL